MPKKFKFILLIGTESEVIKYKITKDDGPWKYAVEILDEDEE